MKALGKVFFSNCLILLFVGIYLKVDAQPMNYGSMLPADNPGLDATINVASSKNDSLMFEVTIRNFSSQEIFLFKPHSILQHPDAWHFSSFSLVSRQRKSNARDEFLYDSLIMDGFSEPNNYYSIRNGDSVIFLINIDRMFNTRPIVENGNSFLIKLQCFWPLAIAGNEKSKKYKHSEDNRPSHFFFLFSNQISYNSKTGKFSSL